MPGYTQNRTQLKTRAIDQAANRFAYASNFPQKSNLVYDEGFFNHLNSSSIECNATATYSIKDPGSVKISPNFTNSKICTYATRKGQWEVEKAYIPYVQEAKRRGLNCGLKIEGADNLEGEFAYGSDEKICYWAKTADGGWSAIDQLQNYVKEAKRRGLTCGVSR